MDNSKEYLFHIYGIKNDITGDFLYVGCTTKEIYRRLWEHCRYKSSAVNEAIAEYGEENISAVLLTDFYGYKEEAHFIEEQYTEMLNEKKPLFNKRFGDAHTRKSKAKLMKPHKKSKGVENLLKYVHSSTSSQNPS